MMEDKQELIQTLTAMFPIALREQAGMDELHQALSTYINHLIVHEFNQLINLLYRLDISEKKLQQWLLENTATEAGKIIAGLIIERQIQKIKSRNQFRSHNDSISDEEKW